jgi:hypothetical protein
MQDEVLSCGEARLQIDSYLSGEPRSALTAHLAGCDACLEACLDAALRRPPGVRVPEHFREQMLARIPVTAPAEAPEYPWAQVVAATLFPVFGTALWWSGELRGMAAVVIAVLRNPAILAASAAIETAFLLLWLSLVFTAEQ